MSDPVSANPTTAAEVAPAAEAQAVTPAAAAEDKLTEKSMAMKGTEQTGTVKSYNPTRGYGFIKIDTLGEDIFFHGVDFALEYKYFCPAQGDKVSFVIGENEKTLKTKAVSIKPVLGTSEGEYNVGVVKSIGMKGWGFINCANIEHDIWFAADRTTQPWYWPSVDDAVFFQITMVERSGVAKQTAGSITPMDSAEKKMEDSNKPVVVEHTGKLLMQEIVRAGTRFVDGMNDKWKTFCTTNSISTDVFQQSEENIQKFITEMSADFPDEPWTELATQILAKVAANDLKATEEERDAFCTKFELDDGAKEKIKQLTLEQALHLIAKGPLHQCNNKSAAALVRVRDIKNPGGFPGMGMMMGMKGKGKGKGKGGMGAMMNMMSMMNDWSWGAGGDSWGQGAWGAPKNDWGAQSWGGSSWDQSWGDAGWGSGAKRQKQ